MTAHNYKFKINANKCFNISFGGTQHGKIKGNLKRKAGWNSSSFGKIFLIRHLLTKIALLGNCSVTIQMYCKMRMVSDFWPISCGKSNCSIWQCSRRSSVFQTPKRLVAKTKLTSNKNHLCLRFDAAVHTNLYSSIFLAMCFTEKSAIGR